jgi:hypothetical protein
MNVIARLDPKVGPARVRVEPGNALLRRIAHSQPLLGSGQVVYFVFELVAARDMPKSPTMLIPNGGNA